MNSEFSRTGWREPGKEKATFRERTLSQVARRGEAESGAVRTKTGRAKILLQTFLNTSARGLYLGGTGEPLEVLEQGSGSPEL